MKSFAAVIAIASIAAAQTTAGTGANPQVASCASSYQICAGSGTAVATCQAQQATCNQSCATKYDACRAPTAAGSANQAGCAADYATCLGVNPFTGPASGVTTVTEVVSSYTTYCPAATSVVQNGQTYVATGPTVLTITNCPCTVTRAVSSVPSSPAGNNGGNSGNSDNSGNGGSGASSVPGNAAVTTPATNYGKTNSTPSYTPVAYQGDASKMVGAGLSFAGAAAAALAFFL